MGFTKFKRRQKIWFVNRVGELIEKEATIKSKSAAIGTIPDVMTIMNERHAASLHVFHLDNKINFNQKTTSPA